MVKNFSQFAPDRFAKDISRLPFNRVSTEMKH